MRLKAVTTFFSALDDSHRMLGFLCYGETPMTDRTYDLYWLAVEPKAHGKGVARSLLTYMEEMLNAKKARILLVETSSRSIYEKARTFYMHNGFIEEARVQDFYSMGDDRIIYKKLLSAR